MTVTATEAGSREVEVRADEDFPVNRGQMCIKGFTSAALLDHPARLRSPMLRMADGRLAPVGWDTAMAFVADKISILKERHGAAAIGAFGSGALTNEKAYLLGKFVRVVLGSPNIDYNGRYCMASAAAGQNRAFGIDRGLPFPVADIAEANVLMLWGSNCAETMPPIMQWVYAQKDRGGQPHRGRPPATPTRHARRHLLHLQLTPGTDLALANGLLHLAIRSTGSSISDVTSRARTKGFDEVRRAVLVPRDPA